MADDKANGRRPREWARVGFWGSAAVSTAANIAATVVAWGTDPVGIFVAALAPLMLLVSIEIVSRPGKPTLALTETITADFVADDAAVPVSPAPAGTASRGDYGPRDPERGYAPSTIRNKTAAAKRSTNSAV